MPNPPPVIPSDQPVLLDPVYIAKPWGQEIWYTGIESRGESGVMLGDQRLPLSDYLAQIALEGVLLLKVLDPKPQSVVGDLYVEVHEQKQEVYVVTHVDPAAWPDGAGGLRFGINQAKRRQYRSDQLFRDAYLDAVQAYEQVRRQIDERKATGLEDTERALRAAMESFIELMQVRVGDVVRVPTWTPHSLQHGVRVVEFQTPTYERYIISFAQQVLTQKHWDSAHAIKHLHLDPPSGEPPKTVNATTDRVAAFEDFAVWRMRVDQQPQQLPNHLPYAVLMALTDGIQVGPLTLQAEQACLLPGAAIGSAAAALSAQQPGLVVTAAPGL